MPIQTLRKYMTSARSSIRTGKKKRPVLRRQLGSRFGVEQLEERRLMVADLVNFLTNEHVDLNISNTSGQWQIGPRNSDAVPAIQYGNDDAILYAGSSSVIGRPGGSSFDFIGNGAGQPVYVLPQSQDPEVIYLGFAAYGLDSSLDRYNPSVESKGRASGNARWGKASLVDLRHSNPDGTAGTGQFSVWQSGTFGEAIVSMSSYNDGVSNPNGNGLDTTDGISTDDAIWILAGGHSHYNFGFTQPGRYEVDLRLSAYFGDDGLTTPKAAGFSQSAPITLYFSVMSVGQLQFDASSYSVNEGGGSASINVVRVGGSDGRITVNYATSNGTATSGSDYSARSGTLEFLDGEKIKTITIPITDDSSDEADETVNLTLSNPGPFEVSGPPQPFSIQQYLIDVEGDANGLLGTVTTAVLAIVDNDEPTNTPPSISNVEDQVTSEDTVTGAIAFTVSDTQSAAGSLVVTATSSNTTLVPNANVVLGGSGTNRTVTITPASNLFGTSTITLTVTDAGGLTATDTFLLTVNSVNDLPTISDVGNQSTDEDTATGAIPFIVGDVETAAGALVVTAVSSNTTLVPNANVVLGGSTANRTITLTPAANQTGTTTITLTVTDEGGLTASDTFTLTVGGVDDAPTISDVGNQSTNEDTTTGAIAFTVNDLETATGSLVVTATSSNTALVPNGNIVFGGSGANRTAVITPALNQFGSTTITLTVTDAGGLTATDSFVLDVAAVNDLPTISDIANRFVLEGSSTGAIAFSVGDVETAAGELVVTATSSNQTVIPNGKIVLGGSGANRTLTINSVPNQVGPTTITVTVTDANGAQASDTFVLTVGDLVRATFDKSVAIKSVNNLEDTRLADIDNDGDLDILYAKRATSISILPNNGNGTFGTEIVLPAITVSDIHVADMNGDSLPDIVSSVYDDTTFDETAIAIWHNLGGGSFSARQLVESTRTSTFVGLIGVGDVNGDGLKDLLLSHNSDPSVNGISYSRNLGGGMFGPVAGIFSGGVTWGSAVHDLDQDGDLDIVRVHDMNDTFQVQLLRNSGASTPVFTSESLASFGGDSGGHIAVSDTNQDGFVDIHLIRRNSTRDILALRGTATGVFSAPIVIASGGTEPHFTGLRIGDVDGDSRPDLVLSRRDSNDVLFAQNLGAGTFTELQEFTSDGAYLNPGHEWVDVGDIDGDGRTDLVYGERFGDRIAWSRNRSEEDITALTPPASRTYLNGYPMTFDVFLGFNAKLNTSGGSPTLPVTIGSQTIQVPFIGQPNANTLRFRYLVQSSDIDLDGIQVASSVALNGATITDVHDRLLTSELLEFPSVNTTGVLVNGGAPYVTGIMRLDATPATSSSVRFAVTFSEPVTGVTMNDFSLDASGPTGATITSVTGSGNSYVVTANIGTGDGTLKLRVLDDDSIIDVDSQPLGGVGVGSGEFAFGQGYTIRSSTATPVFNNVITDGHLDLSLLLYEGTWYPYWNGVGFWDTTDTVLSAGPDARATRPGDPKWDFLGAAAGETVWIFPETFSTTTPWPGVGAYDNQPGTFARYFESDPRVNATSDWLKMQLLDVRGPEGGEFSLYQSGVTDPVVFMSSANGIGVEDTAWIPNLDHIHYNWAFSKPGLYQIGVVASGYIDFNQTGTYEPGVDPLSESQIITLHFAVELGAIADQFTLTGRETLRGSVTLNDQSEWGIDNTTATIENTATKGMLSFQPNGSFTYQPSAIFDGSDSFTYRLTNPRGGFTTATVTITGSVRPDFDVVLKTGHADIGVNFADDAWDLHIHRHEPDTEYEPDAAKFYVGRDAMLIRTGDAANAAYDFLGAPVGSTLFVLPEVENPNLLFLGIGGEELADGLLQGDVAKLRLASVSGPGHFSMWQAGLTPTTPKLLMATADGIDASDEFDVAAGSHAHANFAFTKIGFYEVTFVASGIDADGNATDSGQVTYYFQVGNTVDALDVQNGQVQRSFVRNVDLVFGEEDNMTDLLATGRISVTKFDLNGENGVLMAASAWSASTVGNRLRMDFGVQGIGGNRNATAADGYYRIGIDIDGNGTADAFKHFYRLLGDVNGDRQVNALDRLLVMRGNVPGSPSVDVNGDGVVNAVDLTLVTRGQGKKLKNGLWIDD